MRGTQCPKSPASSTSNSIPLQTLSQESKPQLDRSNVAASSLPVNKAEDAEEQQDNVGLL